MSKAVYWTIAAESWRILKCRRLALCVRGRTARDQRCSNTPLETLLICWHQANLTIFCLHSAASKRLPSNSAPEAESWQYDHGFLPFQTPRRHNLSFFFFFPFLLFFFLIMQDQKPSYPCLDTTISLCVLVVVKSKWQFTYSLIVSKLEPGFILHGALAQVNSWRRKEGNREVKRAAEFVRNFEYFQWMALVLFNQCLSCAKHHW